MARPGVLQRWDREDRELFLRIFLTIVVTLAAALVVLFVTMWIQAYVFTDGHPLLSLEIRTAILVRSFSSMAVVMFVAFGVVAVRISRMVVVRVRRREGERLTKEMQFAREIQAEALPQRFPPYPDHREFDIYATMRPARDVGGDFYDFYFAGPDRFVFLVADVSGKGIPAALFMMRAKSLLKGHIQTGFSLATAVSEVNALLCDGNAAGLFVTAWIAELDVRTGRVSYVNAGHNPPIRRRADAYRADYLRDAPGLFLGAFPDAVYRERILRFRPGDSLYLYTDGITEQVNEALELFGENRLREVVAGTRATRGDLLDYVSRSVVRFGGEADQTDDRTQLEFVWRGVPARTVREYGLTMEALTQASADLEKDLADLPFETKMTILTAADEIFVNIIRHSGASKWSMTVERDAFPDELRLILEDDGRPFDPLEFKDPDTSISIEDRPVGGLGIFIVKKTMSPVTYVWRDGRNVLTLGKALGAPVEPIELTEKPLESRRVERRT